MFDDGEVCAASSIGGSTNDNKQETRREKRRKDFNVAEEAMAKLRPAGGCGDNGVDRLKVFAGVAREGGRNIARRRRVEFTLNAGEKKRGLEDGRGVG